MYKIEGGTGTVIPTIAPVDHYTIKQHKQESSGEQERLVLVILKSNSAPWKVDRISLDSAREKIILPSPIGDPLISDLRSQRSRNGSGTPILVRESRTPL